MRSVVLAILLLVSQLAEAQILKNVGIIPFVDNFTAEDYKAEKQNFSVTQDNRGLIYVANIDEAVLAYDGARWSRISVRNTPVISLCYAYDDNIYVGAKNDLGYLQKTPVHGLVYKSLKPLIPEKKRVFGKVWQVNYTKDSSIVYLSSLYLFFYKHGKLRSLYIDSVAPRSLFLRMFKVNGDLYFSLKYKGLYKYTKDSLVFIPGSQRLWPAMAMLPYPSNQILIFSFFDGFYLFDGKTIKKIDTPVDSFLLKNVYRAIPVTDKYYAFALVSGGVLITDLLLRPVQYIDANTGLYNDKVQNLFLDKDNNLWLALDNGIASVHLFSPFTVFDHNYGFKKSTKTFSALLYNDTLYIANSDGLYARRWLYYEDKTKPLDPFVQIKNANTKTYVIRKVDGDILAASDLGLYQVKNGKAYFITNDRTVRNFVQLRSNPDVIIGVSNSLLLFKRDKKGRWHFIRNVSNFNYPIRYIAEDTSGFIWGSESTFGIYKIYLDKSFDSVERVVVYNKDNGLHGLPAQYKNFVFALGKKIVFTTVDGFYHYLPAQDSFAPISELNNAVKCRGPINLAYQDTKGNIWFKQQIISKEQKHWVLGFLHKTDTGYSLVRKPFYPFINKVFSFVQLDNNSYLIGSEGGFIHYDSRIRVDWQRRFDAIIRTVKIINADSVIFRGYGAQGPKEVSVLKYKFNNLRFVFSADYYRFPKKIQYSYFLKGYDDSWSAWSPENVKEFSNLPAGTYTFYVKSRNIYGQESRPDSYKFVVKPPWYLTLWAFVLYAMLAGLIIWLIVYLYTLRLRKQKEYLEEQVRLRTIEIEQQKHEIEVQRDLLAKQNEEIGRKNKDITDSIEYAKRIQTAILPLNETIQKYLPEYFILYRPRDIVSGDFYWFAYNNGKIVIAAVDCTGHGVPGAFMSMIGAEILNTIVLSQGITDAGEILNLQHKYIRSALKQDTSDNQDGMDMALCVIDREKGILEFAGAKNPLIYITKDDELHKIRGDRQSIGGFQYEEQVSFKKHIIEIDSPMWFYIFSDGYQDQFGGVERRKFMTRNFYKLLHSIHQLPMEEQKRVLEETIETWMSGTSQTDDILVIGFKL